MNERTTVRFCYSFNVYNSRLDHLLENVNVNINIYLPPIKPIVTTDRREFIKGAL